MKVAEPWLKGLPAKAGDLGEKVRHPLFKDL
jgi:hypothetical protein